MAATNRGPPVCCFVFIICVSCRHFHSIFKDHINSNVSIIKLISLSLASNLEKDLISWNSWMTECDIKSSALLAWSRILNAATELIKESKTNAAWLIFILSSSAYTHNLCDTMLMIWIRCHTCTISSSVGKQNALLWVFPQTIRKPWASFRKKRFQRKTMRPNSSYSLGFLFVGFIMKLLYPRFHIKIEILLRTNINHWINEKFFQK